MSHPTSRDTGPYVTVAQAIDEAISPTLRAAFDTADRQIVARAEALAALLTPTQIEAAHAAALARGHQRAAAIALIALDLVESTRRAATSSDTAA